MNKQEYVQIWEKVYDANEKEFREVSPLTKEDVEIIVNLMSAFIERMAKQ